ncbi:MAG: sulfatase-like hydrolase/transferase [Verrucomicrobiae bacterium]|nr:sulfatase-like hydrolase/transferase [Verrucomicrobiae bacterium]
MRYLSFFLATLAIISISLAAKAADKPHIILVMADDQGWGDMAYNGHTTVKTPNFDDAAATGLRFDRFYAAAPVCSPTRASVMTGRHPNRMGVFKWGYPMRPQETTLAEALKTAGYTTGHFGKWHLGSVRNESPANPGKNGFDRWVSAPNFYDNDAVMSDEGKAVQRTGESSFIAVDDALAWMKEVLKGDAPIFSVIWFGSPHSPHRAVEEDRALYADQPEAMQHFLGEVTGMDRAFGKLRDSLTELGIRDNTILWYCSDNGALPKVGSTGGFRGTKGKVYEGGLLVPAILEWPAKIPAPRITDLRCNTSDIYPTLLEIVGVTMPHQPPLDGVSLVPLINNQAPASRAHGMGFWDHVVKGVSTPSDAWMGELLAAQQAGKDLPAPESSQIAAQLPNPPHPTDAFPGHAAWIKENWKLHRIEDPKKVTITWELYNLAADPYEEKDLAASETERVAAMTTELENWLSSVARSLNGEDY